MRKTDKQNQHSLPRGSKGENPQSLGLGPPTQPSLSWPCILGPAAPLQGGVRKRPLNSGARLCPRMEVQPGREPVMTPADTSGMKEEPPPPVPVLPLSHPAPRTIFCSVGPSSWARQEEAKGSPLLMLLATAWITDPVPWLTNTVNPGDHSSGCGASEASLGL